MELLTFKVNGTPYGIRTELINTIIKRVDITENTVTTVKCVKGTISYMNKVIPVIDIAEYLFSNNENQISNKDTFIICTDKNSTLAFITNGVDGILPIKQSEIIKACDIIKEMTYMLEGFIKRDSAIVSIINLEQVIESLLK